MSGGISAKSRTALEYALQLEQRKRQTRKVLAALVTVSKKDRAAAHEQADRALLALIADEEIEELYGAVEKWYAGPELQQPR